MSIKVQKLTHTYMPGMAFERTALKDIDFQMERGEFVGLIGHTGSGKSTLIQLIIGLLNPTAGKVYVDGIDIHEKGEASLLARRKIGMVFQYPEHQLFEETIEADVAFGPKNLKLSEEELQRRVKKALEFVGLDYETYKDRSPFQLSGGQRRRVAIAGVLALEPEILILDEPSAGLDPRGRKEILEQIEKLHKETQMGVVLISHNMEDVARFASRIVVLKQGEIVMDDSPSQVFGKRAKELDGTGIEVPPLNEILYRLNHCGFSVNPATFDLSDAAKQISDSLRGEEVC